MSNSSSLAMTRGETVVVISDAIVDIVTTDDGVPVERPGGAGMNLAIGVRRLGMDATLLSPLGADSAGRFLAKVASEEGIRLLGLDSALPTGVAVSQRVNGEPTYRFNAAVHNRDYHYRPEEVKALQAGDAVAVNSFPMDAPKQVELLLSLLQEPGLPLLVDPNARPSLLSNLPAYRAGFLRLVSNAALVKLSSQDIEYLRLGPVPAAIRHLLDGGARAVVLTMGAAGAVVATSDGVIAEVPGASRHGLVVDTMGAGDAVSARLAVELASRGLPETVAQWSSILHEAMRLAAAVCQVAGGNLHNSPLSGSESA